MSNDDFKNVTAQTSRAVNGVQLFDWTISGRLDSLTTGTGNVEMGGDVVLVGCGSGSYLTFSVTTGFVFAECLNRRFNPGITWENFLSLDIVFKKCFPGANPCKWLLMSTYPGADHINLARRCEIANKPIFPWCTVVERQLANGCS